MVDMSQGLRFLKRFVLSLAYFEIKEKKRKEKKDFSFRLQCFSQNNSYVYGTSAHRVIAFVAYRVFHGFPKMKGIGCA